MRKRSLQNRDMELQHDVQHTEPRDIVILPLGSEVNSQVRPRDAIPSKYRLDYMRCRIASLCLPRGAVMSRSGYSRIVVDRRRREA